MEEQFFQLCLSFPWVCSSVSARDPVSVYGLCSSVLCSFLFAFRHCHSFLRSLCTQQACPFPYGGPAWATSPRNAVGILTSAEVPSVSEFGMIDICRRAGLPLPEMVSPWFWFSLFSFRKLIIPIMNTLN